MSATFPLNGLFIHVNLTTVVLLVARRLILAVGMIFNQGVTLYALDLLVSSLLQLVYSIWLIQLP